MLVRQQHYQTTLMISVLNETFKFCGSEIFFKRITHKLVIAAHRCTVLVLPKNDSVEVPAFIQMNNFLFSFGSYQFLLVEHLYSINIH